jgi:uncharacterized protein involved in response to NO
MGELTLTTVFAPRDWHVHEMLYGYLPAAITGFLFMVRSALLLVAWSVATKANKADAEKASSQAPNSTSKDGGKM